MGTSHDIKGRHAGQLDYVHSMLAQLRMMAESDGHDMLAYLIEMACIEASEKLNGVAALAFRQDQRN